MQRQVPVMVGEVEARHVDGCSMLLPNGGVVKVESRGETRAAEGERGGFLMMRRQQPKRELLG